MTREMQMFVNQSSERKQDVARYGKKNQNDILLRGRSYSYVIGNLLVIVMAAMLSLGLSSCKDDDDPAPTLTVERESVSFSSGGGNASITVICNTVWSVTGGDSWLTVTKSSNAVNLLASKNESTEKKETIIIVKTDDGSLSQRVTVTIEGAGQILELSGLDAPFEKTDQSQQNAQELLITCNAAWEIKGKPDWINVSNLKGNGNMSVKVWPNSINNSLERRATIIVKSGSREVSKEIIQKGISTVYARPKDIVTLTESSVWGYDFSNDLHHVYFRLLPELTANGLTDSDIQQSILIESERWVRRTPQQFKEHGNYFSWYDIVPNTSHVLISVSYDDQNNIGEINRTAIKTKIDDMYNSPYIDVENIHVSLDVVDNQFVYRIQSTKDSRYSAYANKFYSWAIAGTTEFKTLTCTDAQIAYLISQEIRNNPAPHSTYVNGTDRNAVRERLEGPIDNANYTLPANYLNDMYLQVVHWCTLANGTFSGKISWYWYDLQNTSDSKVISVHEKSNKKTPKIIQFDPQELKKEYKVIRLN